MSQSQTRKRPAPGSSPLASNMQHATYPAFPNVSNPAQLSNDQFLSWGVGDNNTYPSTTTATSTTAQTYPLAEGASFTDPNQSNQLVRRNLNQQLTTRSGRQAGQFTPNQDPWGEHEIATSSGLDVADEDDAEIEARVAAAKRDALSKRLPKQIPPFIQKLSSFLDKDYTDLIRWSDDGNSFIVVDEDKFAQKLIPELWKHNNYASFVRQLNMYGFHKIVGLSDNSMRASEKKAKTPREYKHKYFKRGRPDLLWLIEKPQNKTSKPSKNKGTKGENHENTEEEHEEILNTAPDEADQQGNTDLTTVPKADVASLKSLRKEVESLQKSQQQIFSILARMRDENNQYIRQASAMVANHERHESSINAILTFLATFYNQTLQDREGAGNMFAHTFPNNQPQGSVVDVGDYPESTYNQHPQFAQTRRPLALLPPPATPDSSATEPSSATPRPRTRSVSQKTSNWSQAPNLRASSVASQASSAQTPDQSGNSMSPRLTKDNNEILNVINRSNANIPQDNSQRPKFDFNSALQHYQNSNGNAPLTPEQRNAMLSIMANNSGTSTPTVKDNQNDNDLTPYLDYFNSNHESLEMLQRLQEEQDNKVQDIAGRLQPLSPSGSIPGLDLSHISSNPNLNINPPYNDGFDINNFLDDEYLGAPNTDFDFSQFDAENNTNTAQAKAQPNATPANAMNTETPGDASLFGDENNDVAFQDDYEADNDGDGVGRIVGSVSSSGRLTPSVEDNEGNNAEELTQSPKKRRRTAR